MRRRGITNVTKARVIRFDPLVPSFQMASIESISPVTVTPILDSAIRSKPVRKKKVVGVIWGALIGLAFAALMIRDDQKYPRSPAADYMVFFISR
jgi:hypothetical protein